MTTQEKILVPSSTGKSNVVLEDCEYNIPENYSLVLQPNGYYILQDKMGRVQINHLFNEAKRLHPEVAVRTPTKWLASQTVKDLRSNYKDLIGFDPVSTVNGGNRQEDSQSAIRHSENSEVIDPYYYINISTNGNIQTYGTYMTDRMFMSYAAWVSFDFRVFIDNLLIQAAGGILTSGLVLSTDELHKENLAVNSRYANWSIEDAPTDDRWQQCDDGIKDIQDYVALLRSGFNINIDTGQYLRWLLHEGLVYKSYLSDGADNLAVYLPKDVFLNRFFISRSSVNNGTITRVTAVTNEGHLATIEGLQKSFPQITE